MWLRVLTGRHAGRTVPLADESVVVGRLRSCDLVIRDEGVSPRHARFLRRPDGGYVLEDLGSERGTFVSGRRIARPVALDGDEELCFGETFVVLSSARSGRMRSRWPLALAAVLGVAVVGGTAAVLLPRTGAEQSREPKLAAATVEAEDSVVRESPEETLAAPADPVIEAPATAQDPEATSDETEPTRYSDDFSDPASGWEVFDQPAGSSRYERGVLVVTVEDTGHYATIDSGWTLADPVVQVTVLNSARATQAGFGVVCRYRGEDDFYALVAGADGSAAVLRQKAGELSVVSGGGAWTPSADVPVGAPRYRLRAECGAGELTLSVNGRQVVSAAVDAGDRGTIGLFVTGRVEARFDDVRARA